MQRLSKRQAVKWTLLTIVTPLAVSLFAANAYVFAWYMRMDAAGTPYNGPPPNDVVFRGVMLTAGVGLWFTVFLWWLLWRKTCSFGELFATRSRHLPIDLVAGSLLGAGWVGVYGALGWPPFSAMFVFDTAKLASLPTSISAGFCEEFLFRGFVMLVIARAGGGVAAQVVWSSLAFGAAHFMWGPVGMLFTVALGASFAGVSLWRGSVWPAVVAHTLLDLCIEPAMFEQAMTYAAR